MSDQRYELAKERFESLSNEELQRILDNIDKICWDTFNFDDETNTFCPIAVAMNLHNDVSNPTDSLIKEKIGKRFIPANIFKGTPGLFYTTNRKEDTISLCKEILNKRKKGMTINHYQQEALFTAIYPDSHKINYPILGLCGEAGELANKYKKIIRDKNGKVELSDLLSLADEAGDVLWYIATLANDLGYTLQEIANININKLKSRQERGTIQGSGDTR